MKFSFLDKMKKYFTYVNIKGLRKLYNYKYMITLTQIRNIEIFAFITVLVLKLLSRKVLFINRKHKRNC